MFSVVLLVLTVLSLSWYCFKRNRANSRGDWRTVSESSSQDAQESPVNQVDEVNQMGGSDEPDAATHTEQKASHQIIQLKNYEKVHHSLQQLFQCVYTQLVLPWYTAPEDTSRQPLYNALLNEYNLAVDLIISKVRDLDIIGIVLNCIPIITQHLRSAKQSDGSSAFSSTTDEMNVLRDYLKALIHNLLPQHIWEQPMYYCVIREILATKAFDLVVMLSDPDTLNNLIVAQLEEPTNPPSIENADKGDSPSSVPSEDIVMPQDDNTESMSEDKPKKRGNLFKYYYNKLTNIRRRKKKESARVCAALETDGESIDDDMVDNDDKMEKMEFKIFYEVWKAGKWTVTVTNVQKDMNKFTIHLEESNPAEGLKWDVEKTNSEITSFYNYFKDQSHLPSIGTIINNSATETEWNEDEARKSLENFLQGVMTDQNLGSSEIVFTFLCPLFKLSEDEQYDGMWDMLAGIAVSLNFDQEQDDELDKQRSEEKKKDESHHGLNETQPANESTVIGPHKEAISDVLDKICQGSLNSDYLNARLSEKEDGAHTYNCDHSETSSSGIESTDDELQHLTKHTRQAACLSSDSDSDSTDKSTTSIRDKCRSDGGVQKRDNLIKQKILTGADKPAEVIFDLLEEISENSIILKAVKALLKPLCNKAVKGFIKIISLSEDQVAGCINNLCKGIRPEEDAPQQSPRSREEKNETKQKALKLITLNFSNRHSAFVISKANWTNTFKIFQNAEENKKLIYNLMSHLLKELMSGKYGLDVTAKLNVKHPVQ